MSGPKRSRYAQGYFDGQADALAFLNNRVESDYPFDAISIALTLEYSMWCLSFCLMTAAACARAAKIGASPYYGIERTAAPNGFVDVWKRPLPKFTLDLDLPKKSTVTDYNDDWQPGKDGDIWGYSYYGRLPELVDVVPKKKRSWR